MWKIFARIFFKPYAEIDIYVSRESKNFIFMLYFFIALHVQGKVVYVENTAKLERVMFKYIKF